MSSSRAVLSLGRLRSVCPDPIIPPQRPSLTAVHRLPSPPATDAEKQTKATTGNVAVSNAGPDAAATAEPVRPTATDNTTMISDKASDKPAPAVKTASTSPSEMLPTEASPVQSTTASE